MNVNDIEWVKIPGFNAFACRDGLIKKFNRQKKHWQVFGEVIHHRRGKPSYTTISVDGKSCQIHVLVALTFLGSRPPGSHINHKNGLKCDNRLANLEYVTPIENAAHAIANDLTRFGEKHYAAKITPEIASLIFLAKGKESPKSLSVKFGLDRTTIYAIWGGKSWNRVTGMPRQG